MIFTSRFNFLIDKLELTITQQTRSNTKQIFHLFETHLLYLLPRWQDQNSNNKNAKNIATARTMRLFRPSKIHLHFRLRALDFNPGSHRLSVPIQFQSHLLFYTFKFANDRKVSTFVRHADSLETDQPIVHGCTLEE